MSALRLFPDAMSVRNFDDLLFNVSAGRIPSSQAFTINKFGQNLDIDSTKADVWAAGGTKTDTSSADALEVLSADAADDGDPAGTGARTVRIFGYDSNTSLISEDVTMNGVTAVETTQQFLDVYRAFVLTAGSGVYNAGAITIRQKTGPVTVASIPAGYGQTQMSHFIIPSGFSGFFLGGNASIGGIQGGGGVRIGDLHLEVKTNGGTWRITDTFGGTSNSGIIPLNLRSTLKFDELTHVKASCTAETANTRAYAQYEVLVISENLLW